MSRRVLEGPVIYHFTPSMAPAWTVQEGEALTVRCPDGMRGRIQTEDDRYEQVDPDAVNDAVGPILVEGAHPGDTLAVDLEEVRVPTSQGYVLLIPGFGLLQERVDEPKTAICPIEDGVVHFRNFRLPVRPCIGTIGVSPATGRISTIYPGDHGGNMDTTDITSQTTLYLPVAVEGALLAMGDGKAVMGDGEVCGTGVGVPLDIDLTCRVLRGVSIPRPVIETTDRWMTVGSAPTLEASVRLATEDMIALLQRSHALSFEDAYMLCSLAGDLVISQVVDPWMTVRMVMHKETLQHRLLA